jgi:hypothetical protein
MLRPFSGGILGLLLGAVLGWLLGGECITFLPENQEGGDQVRVAFFSFLPGQMQETDLGDGVKVTEFNRIVNDVYILSTRQGHSGIATQVQIVYFVMRALVGGLFGAVIGLVLDVRRLRRKETMSHATQPVIEKER